MIRRLYRGPNGWSRTRQVSGLVGVVLQTAGRAIRGEPLRRSKADYAHVRGICQTWGELEGCFDARPQRCRICGCVGGRPLLDLWKWEAKHCPRSRW